MNRKVGSAKGSAFSLCGFDELDNLQSVRFCSPFLVHWFYEMLKPTVSKS